jgi:hypothetical protein
MIRIAGPAPSWYDLTSEPSCVDVVNTTELPPLTKRPATVAPRPNFRVHNLVPLNALCWYTREIATPEAS